MRKTVFVTSSFAGLHRWPDAPDAVSFLRNLHRHLFGVRAETIVKHDNRQVEFFIFKRDLQQAIRELRAVLNSNDSMSCEMMGEIIVTKLQALGYKITSVEVNEDGENGAIVTVNQDEDYTAGTK